MTGATPSLWLVCTGPVSSPMSGYRTRFMKHCATWYERGTQPVKMSAGTASGSRRSCSVATCASKVRPGHRMWLCNRTFTHPAQQIAFQTYLNALEHNEARKVGIEQQIREVITGSPWAKQMQALQALKGVGPIVAATVLAEVGDFSRFAHPRQLVAYFGLAPGEHSSGGTVRPRGITKAGSSIARAVLCEAAWSYRTTPKVGHWMKERCPPVSQDIAALAWKAQLRLHKTYRKLTARGKRSVVATAAVARELLGFIWSIGQRVPLGA